MRRITVTTSMFAGVLISGSLLLTGCGGPGLESQSAPSIGELLSGRRTGKPNPPETLTIDSRILGERRPIYVQLPDGYERSSERYPLLLVMDGEWLFDLAAAHIRYYSFDEVTDVKIPRTIVVGIPNLDRDRNYTPTARSGVDIEFPTAGEAKIFLRFLERELIPLIDRQYRTHPGRAIAGWSFSGLFSAYAAVERPDLFQAHLCISPAIWWDDDLIFRRMQTLRLDRPKRMVFTLGAGEAGGWVHTSTKRLLKWLEDESIPELAVRQFEFADVGHTWGVASAMDKGLQALYEDYVAPRDVIDGGLTAVTAYYDRLSRRWSYPVTPPNKVLQAIAYQEWSDDHRDAAIAILKAAVENDPLDSVTHFELGSMFRATGDAARARRCFEDALRAETEKPVPNEVNVRMYREAIESLKA